MSDVKRLGEHLDALLHGIVHPSISDAVVRERAGEQIDWPALYAAIDAEMDARHQPSRKARHEAWTNAGQPRQLLLGVLA